MLCPKLPIWDLCQQPRPRVDSPRRLIMLTNAHSQVSQRVMSVTDIHRDSEAGSLSYRMSWNTNASCSPPGWNARECDQSSSDQAPGVPMSQSSVSSVSWSGPGTQLRCSLRNNLASPLQAISMKPMSNRIVLALVVIWNCNVSMKMPPKIDFFITRKDFALKLNYFHHKQVSYPTLKCKYALIFLRYAPQDINDLFRFDTKYLSSFWWFFLKHTHFAWHH